MPFADVSMVEGDHVPVTPFGEVVASAGGVDPWQTAMGDVKLGVVAGVTLTWRVKGEAHCPVVGVKMYEPFADVSMVEGDHVPVTPFGEVVASAGGVDPWHNISGDAKLGVVAGVTLTCSVNDDAHCPVVGVKTYVPFADVLMVEGDHVPVTPFGEVVASVGGVDPWHKLSGDVKLGVVAGVTLTCSVNDDAHCPVVGVKTYVPFADVLIVEGDHVPVTPFGEVVASVGGVDPWQTVSGDAKLGVVAGVTLTCSVNDDAHCPVVGVKT